MNRKIWVAAAVSFFTTLALSKVPFASAEFHNGNDLYGDCLENANDPGDGSDFSTINNFCSGYIVGVVDADVGISRLQKVCWYSLPADVTPTQIIGTVREYLKVHTDQRDFTAPSLVLLAMREAFPCPK